MQQENVTVQKAPVCQKCGHTGFQEVMIYCRQCKKNCEHKYCLYKFPKKGEKVRWYCEECKPTIFPISSPDKLDVDTETSKIDLKCTQTIQNQKQNQNLDQIQDKNQNKDQKFEGQSVSSISHLEKVQEETKSTSDLKWKPTIFPISSPNKLELDTEDQSVSSTSQPEKVQKEAKNMKSPSSDFGENRQDKYPRRPILFNNDQLNQNVPNTLLTLSRPPTTGGEIIVHEVSVPETIAQRNKSHQEILDYNPESDKQITPSIAVWRGCISFGDDEFLPFKAHGCTLACQRVLDTAKLLPPILPLNKYSGCDMYKTIFKNGPPADDKIGLYILPDSCARPERISCLIDDIIKKDLMFVYSFDEIEVEMLVFHSCILPEEHQQFQNQYYLWAGFRTKQLLITVEDANDNSEPTIKNIEDSQGIQEVSTCRESQRTIANAKKRHIENEDEIDVYSLINPITEKNNLAVDMVNETRVQEKSENRSKNFISSDAENQKSIEEISKKYKQKGMTTSSPSKCIEKKNHDQATKEQNKKVTFYNNYVSDFYGKRKIGETTNKNFARDNNEKQRLLVENEKKHRQEKDEINANNVFSSTCTEKQKHVQESTKKSSQSEEKLCTSSPKKRERNRLCIELQRLSDGSKKVLANRDEIHFNGQIRSAAEKQKHRYELRNRDQDRNEEHSSNPNSLAMEKQKAPYNLRKRARNQEENSRASILIRKSIEKQKPMDKSIECNKSVQERYETRSRRSITGWMTVDKIISERKRKDIEHASTTCIRTCTKKQKHEKDNRLADEELKPCAVSSIRTCDEKHMALKDSNKKYSSDDETFISICVGKLKQDKGKENCYGEDEDEIIAGKQLSLQGTWKKLVGDGNVSTEIQNSSEDKATCTEDQKAKENMKNFDHVEEQVVEGDSWNESVGRDEQEINGSGYNNNDDEANDPCLSLFPLRVEDIGVVSKVGGGNKLNLDLGLGRN